MALSLNEVTAEVTSRDILDHVFELIVLKNEGVIDSEEQAEAVQKLSTTMRNSVDY